MGANLETKDSMTSKTTNNSEEEPIVTTFRPRFQQKLCKKRTLITKSFRISHSGFDLSNIWVFTGIPGTGSCDRLKPLQAEAVPGFLRPAMAENGLAFNLDRLSRTPFRPLPFVW
jgi:hypothetical protein